MPGARILPLKGVGKRNAAAALGLEDEGEEVDLHGIGTVTVQTAGSTSGEDEIE